MQCFIGHIGIYCPTIPHSKPEPASSSTIPCTNANLITLRITMEPFLYFKSGNDSVATRKEIQRFKIAPRSSRYDVPPKRCSPAPGPFKARIIATTGKHRTRGYADGKSEKKSEAHISDNGKSGPLRREYTNQITTIARAPPIRVTSFVIFHLTSKILPSRNCFRCQRD